MSIGYSSNDFFYENPAYCGIKSSDKYPGETNSVANITTANENKNTTGNNKVNTLCATNEKYGKLAKERNSNLTTSSSRYEYTLKMYNRELLTTYNYIAGIALIGAYIYVNQRL